MQKGKTMQDGKTMQTSKTMQKGKTTQRAKSRKDKTMQRRKPRMRTHCWFTWPCLFDIQTDIYYSTEIRSGAGLMVSPVDFGRL